MGIRTGCVDFWTISHVFTTSYDLFSMYYTLSPNGDIHNEQRPSFVESTEHSFRKVQGEDGYQEILYFFFQINDKLCYKKYKWSLKYLSVHYPPSYSNRSGYDPRGFKLIRSWKKSISSLCYRLQLRYLLIQYRQRYPPTRWCLLSRKTCVNERIFYRHRCYMTRQRLRLLLRTKGLGEKPNP